MRQLTRHTMMPAALVASTALLLGGGVLLEPAAAQGITTLAALIKCSSSSACASWQNTGSGVAIQGTAAASDGIRGYTSGKTKSGLYGETDSSAGGYGVHGQNLSANGVGVFGTGAAGIGVEATSSGPEAVLASATSGYGVVAKATTGSGIFSDSSSGVGLIAGSNSGLGIDASSYSSYGLAAVSGTGTGLSTETFSATGSALEATSFGTAAGQYKSDGAHVLAYSGNGAVLSNGTYDKNSIDAFTADNGEKFGAIVGGVSQGLIALSGGGTSGIPLQAGSATASGTGTGFFYVDGSGNIHYTGGLISYAHTRGGANVTAYETKSTQSSVEDTGTAQLVAGSAAVPLNAAFAQAIDLTTPYRVFLTPNGDTRGLYVAQKTPTGFVVRETQGGHANLSFDYRIIAVAAGHTADHMTAVTPALQSKIFPMSAHFSTSTFTGVPATPAVPKSAAINPTQ